MVTSDPHSPASFGPGDRIAVIAGSDRLPLDVAEGLRASGKAPLVVMIEGEADPALASFEHEVLALEDVLGLVPLPDFVPVNADLAELIKPWHEISAYALAALVVLHVAAALKHHFIDRDGLLARMLPGRG